MAKFCKYCGTPIEEGAVCTCPQAQAEAAQAAPGTPDTAPQAAPKAAGPSAMAGVIPCLKAYIHAPLRTTRTGVQHGDLTTALIFLAAQLVISGLLLFSILQKVCNMIMDGIKSTANSFGGLSMSDLMELPVVKAPLGGALLYGILMAAVAIALCILVVFSIGKITHSSASLKDAVIACGINSPFVTALLLLALLLSFVSLQIGIIVYSVAMVAWSIMTVLSAHSLVPNHDSGLFWISCIIGVALVSLIATLIATKLFMLPAIGGISISMGGETHKIQEALDQIKKLPDLQTLLQMMIQEAM